MLVTFKKTGESFNIPENIIVKWSAIREYIAIQKLKTKTKEKKAIENILANRKLYEKLLKENNNNLKSRLEKYHKPDLDRFRMKGAKIPFVIR